MAQRSWSAGRTLRDGACQELASASLACEGLRQRLERDCPDSVGELDQIHDTIARALAEVRRVADELEPVAARPEGLAHALDNLAFEASFRAADVAVVYEPRSLVLVADPVVADHLFLIAERAVNEAIAIAMSARANAVPGGRRDAVTVVKLAIGAKRGGVVLRVDAEQSRDTRPPAVTWGSGWSAMIDRTKALGGRLTVSGPLRKGAARIACTFPGGTGRAVAQTGGAGS